MTPNLFFLHWLQDLFYFLHFRHKSFDTINGSQQEYPLLFLGRYTLFLQFEHLAYISIEFQEINCILNILVPSVFGWSN